MFCAKSYPILLLAMLAAALPGCSSGSSSSRAEVPAPQIPGEVIPDPDTIPALPEPLVKNPGDVEVQAAYDEETVALRFSWKSHPKSFPIGFANNGTVYPGQFHDLMTFNGTTFVREPVEDHRFNEDRVAFMLEDPSRPVEGFDKAGCYVACHAGMSSHNLSSGSLDFWHWRGQRSGPMGYAEDTWVDTARKADLKGSAPSAWLNAAGDSLRQDQGALSSSYLPAHGLPRFVFNKGKEMPGGFTIPNYFLTLEDGTVVTDPFAQLRGLKGVDANRTLLVAYQDRTFDPVDKVNAVDVGYLAYVATGETAHLPAHLAIDNAAFNAAMFESWKTFWAQELGIAADPADAAEAAQAQARIADIRQEVRENAVITRSVGFIYPSDQHDIRSTRSFDPDRGIWTVVLYRKLTTGGFDTRKDTDLSSLKSGTVYNLGFAIHDIGDAHESHHISLPQTLGNTSTSAEIKAAAVSDAMAVNWGEVPNLLTRVYAADKKTLDGHSGLVTFTELKDVAKHPGAGLVGAVRCQECHKNGGMAPLLTSPEQ